MTEMLRCSVCGLQVDPVTAPIHPSCDAVPGAAEIRAEHARWMRRLVRDPATLTYDNGRLVGASTWPKGDRR